MITIRNIISERRREVCELYFFLEKLEVGTIHLCEANNRINFPTGVKTVSKSCIIVMLYNVIESVVTEILKRIHNEIIQKNISYNDLNKDIKCIYLLYYNTAISKKNDFSNAVGFAHDLIQFLFYGEKFSLDFEEMEKHYHLYSGNLDSRKISDVFLKYGLNIDLKISELQTIKDARNSLAHGNSSFEEYGRNLSLQRLEVMTNKVFDYLAALVDKVENYLTEEKYRI